MAYSRVSYTANGVQTDYTFGFTYLDRSHVKVTVGGVPFTSFIFLDDHTLRFSPAPVGELVIYRATSPEARMVDYEAPSQLNESDLNVDSEQAFLLTQEALDAASIAEEKADLVTDRVNNIDGTVAEEATEAARVYAEQAAGDRAAVHTDRLAVEVAATSVESAKTTAQEAASAAAAAALAATAVSKDKWLGGLDQVTPAFLNQLSIVSPADTGTHTGRTATSPDADVSGVPNSGIYSAYALTVGAWRRDGDVNPLGAASPSQVVAGLATNLTVTPEGDKAALDARIKGVVISETGADNPYLAPFTVIGPDGLPWLLAAFQRDGRLMAKLSTLSEVPVEALGAAATRLLPDGVEMYVTGVDNPYVIVWDASGDILGGFLRDGSLKAKLSSQCLWPDTLATDAHIFSGPGVIFHGDSLGQGLGTADFQAAFPGVEFINDCRGSQTSTEIAARQGGKDLIVSVTGDVIPASGGVALTAISDDVIRNAGAYSPSAGSFQVLLAGVAGSLSATAANAYTFTRNAPGSATSCPPNSVMTLVSAAQYAYHTMYLWVGHNNIGASQVVVDDIISMIRYHKARGMKRYRVMTLVNDNYNNAGANALIRKTFGHHVLDMRQIILDRGLADCGITPTSEDTAALAIGNIPPSLKADSIHLTGTAHQFCVRPAIIRDMQLMMGL